MTFQTHLFPVNSQTGNLSVEVREVASEQERVVTETNPRDHMASTKGTLLNLREELVDGPVEHEFSNIMKRNEILGPNFGSVEDVKVEFMFVLLFNNLYGKGPLGKCARFNGLFQILTVEICKGWVDIS